jgi:hypothetical protein
VLRKTGRLPSQLLNSYMSRASGGSTGGNGGGSQRIVVDVNLTADQGAGNLPLEAIKAVARQVFADVAHQTMRQQVQY